MSYQVIIPRPVQKQLDALPRNVRDRVIKAIVALKDNPRPRGSVKLRGYENEYRIRIGDLSDSVRSPRSGIPCHPVAL